MSYGSWQGPQQSALLQMLMHALAQRQAAPSPFAMPPPAGGPASPMYVPHPMTGAGPAAPQQGGQNWQLMMMLAQLDPTMALRLANSMPQLGLQQGMYPGSTPQQGQ